VSAANGAGSAGWAGHLRLLGGRRATSRGFPSCRFWRGLEAFYSSDNLTYAAAIAYYALLSLFPFFLLAFALLGRSTADVNNRNAVLEFVLATSPCQFDFITKQLDAFRGNTVSVGVAGSIALVGGSLGVFGAISTAVIMRGASKSSGASGSISCFHSSCARRGPDPADCPAVDQRVAGGRRELVCRVLARFPGLGVLRGFTVHNATTLLFILVVGLIFYFVPNAKVRFRMCGSARSSPPVVEGRARRLLLGNSRHEPFHASQRIDRGRRRVPGVGLRPGRILLYGRRVHGRLRAPAPRQAG